MERTLAGRVCLGIGLRFGRGRVGVRLLPCPGFRAPGRPPMVYCESLAGMLTSCRQGCGLAVGIASVRRSWGGLMQIPGVLIAILRPILPMTSLGWSQ